MENSNNITQKQHFVPKFYLKNFSDKKNFLNILDVKNNRKVPRKTCTAVCYEKFYYAIDTGQKDDSSQQIEEWLGQIENYIAKHLPAVINRIRNFSQIRENDRYILSVLCSMLWMRGPYMRGQLNRMEEDLSKKLFSLNSTERVEEYIKKTGTDWTSTEKTKLIKMMQSGNYKVTFNNIGHLKFMVNSLGMGGKGFANLFFAKNWRIFIAKGKKRFITSDSPVIEWFVNKGFYGTPFLSRDHYLALSPDILLSLSYPQGSEKIRRTTLFKDKDSDVMMYNILIAQHSNKYAYSNKENILDELLMGKTNYGLPEHMYIEKFENPLKEV